LENIPEVVNRSSQKLVGELKETIKVTSINKNKLKREKAQKEQILEPTPQSSKIEIRVGQQKQTPEFKTRELKMKVKMT